MVFYVLLFSAMAVLLVVAGLTMRSRNRRELDAEGRQEGHASDSERRQRKAKRTQSRNARRKRN